MAPRFEPGVVVPLRMCAVVARSLRVSLAAARRDGQIVPVAWSELVDALESGAAIASMSAGGHSDVVVADIPARLAHEVDSEAAAQRLGLSARQVRRLVDTGVLTGRRVGRQVLIDAESVEAEFERRRSAA